MLCLLFVIFMLIFLKNISVGFVLESSLCLGVSVTVIGFSNESGIPVVLK